MATKKVPVQTPISGKKRAVVSYANLSQELLDLWREKYPRGYNDYMEDIIKVDKPDGTFFYAVTFEVEDAIYLVKVDVKIDDYAEVEKDIFGSEEDEEEGSEETEFPDDDSNYSDSDGNDSGED